MQEFGEDRAASMQIYLANNNVPVLKSEYVSKILVIAQFHLL